jgi:hypothetical protein
MTHKVRSNKPLSPRREPTQITLVGKGPEMASLRSGVWRIPCPPYCPVEAEKGFSAKPRRLRVGQNQILMRGPYEL